MNKIIKTNWTGIKHIIKKVNQHFFDLVEAISPDNDMPLYLANYSYGSPLGIKNNFYLPNNHGGLSILGKEKHTDEIHADLSYGQHSAPLGMIVDNFCECCYFNEFTKENYPFAVLAEGNIFNQQIIFNDDISIENNAISAFSGAKSLFMLPYIGCQTHHERLKNKFNLTSLAPKAPSEHYELFKEIIARQEISECWSSQIVIFSQQWIEQFKNNSDWLPLKYFFSENLRKRSSSDLYNSFNNDLFMAIENANRYRPTPFLVDTAKYLFSIFMGKGIGFKPAIDNKLLPLKPLQEAYSEYYQLPYTPTIMVPGVLEGNDSIYYSLQQPSTKINTFKIRMNNSTYRELVALKNILMSFLENFTSEFGLCYGGDLYYACKDVTLEFFHNKPSDTADNIKNSKELLSLDSRYGFSLSKPGVFSADAKFFRGCIKISR